MSTIKTILIVATSGRMLAQLAKNSGYLSIVIDCFSDKDTHDLTLECVKVKQLSLGYVEPAFLALKQRYLFSHVVYGSGLEKNPQTLMFLQQHLIVLGNTLKTFLHFQDTALFFSSLQKLQIPFPEITFQVPEKNSQWLIKPRQGEGGEGIIKYLRQINKADSVYWQKYQRGISMSVLFIAYESEYRVIGFNKQLVTQIGEYEFIFAGVVSQPEVSLTIRNVVTDWLDLLLTEFSLKGINSFDFIVCDEQCYALEVNARPSASMQLYSDELLSEHINSCLLAKAKMDCESDNTCRAYKIIFAAIDVVIHESIEWPLWVLDLPQNDSIINTGMPICSIIASGNTEQQVNDLLCQRQQLVIKLLQ